MTLNGKRGMKEERKIEVRARKGEGSKNKC